MKRLSVLVIVAIIFSLSFVFNDTPTGLVVDEARYQHSAFSNSNLAPALNPTATTVSGCFDASTTNNTPGAVFLLNQSFVSAAGNCLSLDVANVVLDCQGFTATGTGSNRMIEIPSGSNGVTVRNCYVDQAEVFIQASSGVSFENFHLSNSGDEGLDFWNSPLATISDSSFNNVADNSIYVRSNSNNVTISNVTFRNCGDMCIYAESGSSNIFLEDSSIINFSDTGFLINSDSGDGFFIYRNFFESTGSSDYSIDVENSINSVHIINNTFNDTDSNRVIYIRSGVTTYDYIVSGNDFTGSDRTYCVYSQDAQNFTVQYNIKNSPYCFFYLDDTANALVSFNNANASFDINGENSTIERNTWPGDIDGVFAQKAVYARGYNITVRNHAYIPAGVSVRGSTFDSYPVDNMYLVNNTFADNAKADVEGYFVYVEDNVFENLTFSSNVQPGIEVSVPGFGGNPSMVFIRNNVFNQGTMYTIDVNAPNVTISNNTFTNLVGRMILVRANDTLIENNTFTNVSGNLITISPDVSTNITSGTTIRNNTFTFFIKKIPTMYSNNLTVPNISENSFAVGLYGILEDILIEKNDIVVNNPSSLDNNVIGIYGSGVGVISNFLWPVNYSFYNASQDNISIINNTFDSPRDAINLLGLNNSRISENTFTNVVRRPIFLRDSSNSNLSDNIITATQVFGPGEMETGIYLVRTNNNNVFDNTISSYSTGLFLQSSTSDNLYDMDLSDLSAYGVYLFNSDSVSIDNVNPAASVSRGFGLFFTNNSVINGSTLLSSEKGFELAKSFNNNITLNAQSNSAIGVEFDLFSANNLFNTNTLSGNTVDFKYDMFANNNNGTGNIGGPFTNITENGAWGNNIQ